MLYTISDALEWQYNWTKTEFYLPGFKCWRISIIKFWATKPNFGLLLIEGLNLTVQMTESGQSSNNEYSPEIYKSYLNFQKNDRPVWPKTVRYESEQPDLENSISLEK